MGEASIDTASAELIITATIIIYGDAANEALALQMAQDIESIWNEPRATVKIQREPYLLRFKMNGIFKPNLNPEEVWYNDNPQLNFFRVEEYSERDISFVDGLGCNTGYFKLANLLQTATTSAHEFGHTIGLDHPDDLDIRGKGAPGIMYPRGTLCDPQFQYDPSVVAGAKGGTLDPQWRKVLQSDVEDLKLGRLSFKEGKAVVGEFSSIYHFKHEQR